MNCFNDMHLGSEHSVQTNRDATMNFQLKFFRDRLDSLEKKMESNKRSGSTFETNEVMHHIHPRNRTENIESIRLSFLAENQREIEDPF